MRVRGGFGARSNGRFASAYTWRNGSRIDDCQLVCAPRARIETLWLFSNGADLFVDVGDVVDVWEVACTSQAA